MTPLRVFIGYDSREPIAYHVAAHSLLTRASGPVSIMPLIRHGLPMLTRERNPLESTDFAFSRFLVPYLSDYRGVSVFLDSDVLVRCDLVQVVRDILHGPRNDEHHAVFVAQHDYTPKQSIKMDGKVQTAYPRKNWSSVMIFANVRCAALTPEYVNTATGLQLHRFQWLRDDQIGSLPLDLNWLVGEYDKNPDARILHYTNGLPCFRDYANCDHADLWRAEYDAMTAPVQASPYSKAAWESAA